MKPIVRRESRVLPFENLFDHFFGTEFNKNFNDQAQRINPKTNVIESDNEFILEILVPGFEKKEIQINIDKDTMSISAEVSKELNEAKGEYKRKEFVLKSFKRSFTLPEMIINDAISAQYENGVLKLTLPKKEEAKPTPARQISVN